MTTLLSAYLCLGIAIEIGMLIGYAFDKLTQK